MPESNRNADYLAARRTALFGKDTELRPRGGRFSPAYRRQWLALMGFKRDMIAIQLEDVTDSRRRRTLLAAKNRYVALMKMGPEGTSAASLKAARTRQRRLKDEKSHDL
jgi:hypothetical protein